MEFRDSLLLICTNWIIEIVFINRIPESDLLLGIFRFKMIVWVNSIGTLSIHEHCVLNVAYQLLLIDTVFVVGMTKNLVAIKLENLLCDKYSNDILIVRNSFCFLTMTLQKEIYLIALLHWLCNVCMDFSTILIVFIMTLWCSTNSQ